MPTVVQRSCYYYWDVEQRLFGILDKTTNRGTVFIYDGLGRRVREYDADLTRGTLDLAQKADYAWCGSKVCQTRDAWGTTIEMPQGLIREGSPIAYYFHRDHLGSVVDVSQADGNHLARTMYSPYGQKELLSSDAAYVEYAGMRFHEPSGLYLTYYRAYDPKLGRWLSRDPIGEAGGLNLYGYVGCRPGSYTDPWGLIKVKIKSLWGETEIEIPGLPRRQSLIGLANPNLDPSIRAEVDPSSVGECSPGAAKGRMEGIRFGPTNPGPLPDVVANTFRGGAYTRPLHNRLIMLYNYSYWLGEIVGGQMQKSFGSLEVEQRLRADSVLRKLDALIDWNGLRPLLAKLYKRDESRGGGPIPFDELKMFKAVLLGQWHGLSDAKLEEALRVRLDFMDFCGFGLSEAVPDETTLCRFRLRLIEHKRLEALLKRINEQLQGHGLMVRETKGAILDATLIASASRPRRTVIWETDESGQAVKYEYGIQPGVVEERSSADADAAWLKKGKKSYYGYRGYVTVDSEDGYVHGVHTASANQSEMKHLEKALEQVSIEAERLYADKGYASAANRAMLRGRKIKSGIMHRATKNKPLSARQHKANRLISRVRYRVEQTFGTLKRLFKMDRASYRGTERVNGQLILKCIGLNLLKAANKSYWNVLV